jgi:hypothetical protein
MGRRFLVRMPGSGAKSVLGPDTRVSGIFPCYFGPSAYFGGRSFGPRYLSLATDFWSNLGLHCAAPIGDNPSHPPVGSNR